MPDPLAYFLTWTTYGTWLPGDERGWIWKGQGAQLANPVRKQTAHRSTIEPPCELDHMARELVSATIVEHCRIRGWTPHAVNCRTNHVHVVVTAQTAPKVVRDQFKAWCTRKLKELQRFRGEIVRRKWWSEGGSQRWIGDEESLEAVIWYVKYGQ